MTHPFKLEPVEIDLSKVDSEIWAHKLWQKLFDVYREFDCPLDDMHDMMCDFNNIRRLLEGHTTLDQISEFYWYFDPGYRFTVFDIRQHYGEEYGLHFKDDGDGHFTVRHLYTLYEEELCPKKNTDTATKESQES